MGDILEYERSGGYVTVANYEKDQTRDWLEKNRRLRKQSSIDELTSAEKQQQYIRRYPTKDDIELEARKTYLLFAITNNDKYKVNSYRFTKK